MKNEIGGSCTVRWEILTGKSEGIISVGRPTNVRENNIKTCFKEIGFDYIALC